jgi:hypothetical protein
MPSLAVLLSLALSTHPPPDEPVVHDVAVASMFPTKLPFAAWSVKPAAHIKKTPSGNALDIGLIRRGDWVVVKACAPSCDAPRAWALLEPFGAVRLADLRTQPQEQDDALAQATFQRFIYGTVTAKRAELHEFPDVDSTVLRTHPQKHVLAFREDVDVDGWLQRPSKGWMRRSDVRVASPSDLRGFTNPEGAIAIFVREAAGVPRYASRPVYAVEKKQVVVPEGAVPKDAVRLAFRRAPPRGIPAQQKWAHVDLKEQVLTVYDGEQWVFATLVSTGRSAHPTATGVFRVQQKVAHTAMDSERERYFVDEVPFIQYFNGSQGFHGAFWHDRFGTVVSHGCVNLSMEDAAWLFQWSNPRLPEGWQSVISFNANLASMWVHIQKRAPLGEMALPPQTQAVSANPR